MGKKHYSGGNYAAHLAAERDRSTRDISILQICIAAGMIAANNNFNAANERSLSFGQDMCNIFADLIKMVNTDTKDLEYTYGVINRRLQKIMGDTYRPIEELVVVSA